MSAGHGHEAPKAHAPKKPHGGGGHSADDWLGKLILG